MTASQAADEVVTHRFKCCGLPLARAFDCPYNWCMSPHPSSLPPQPPRAGVAGLVRRLLERVQRRPASTEAEQAGLQRHPPPGSRSGRGSESVLPYLAESVQTRPGSLDD